MSYQLPTSFTWHGITMSDWKESSLERESTAAAAAAAATKGCHVPLSMSNITVSSECLVPQILPSIPNL